MKKNVNTETPEEVTCPRCNQEVPKSAITCPFCNLESWHGWKEQLTKMETRWNKRDKTFTKNSIRVYNV